MIKRRRRKTIIISKIQLRMIFAIMGIIIGVSIILLLSLFFIFKANIEILQVPEEVLGQFLSDSMWPVIITAIVIFIVSLWAIILISHKIYGPLYRFGIYVKSLSEGQPTDELKFRKGDAVDGLREVYNALRQALEKTLHYDYQEMVSIFSELQNILDKINNKEIKDAALTDALQNICNRIAKALDKTSELVE
jgi:hypothetical protein